MAPPAGVRVPGLLGAGVDMTLVGDLGQPADEGRIMWGTTATHKMGDISRPAGDFFFVDDEDDNNFYGSWLTGIGFFNVAFPKADSREITEAEREMLRTQKLVIR